MNYQDKQPKLTPTLDEVRASLTEVKRQWDSRYPWIHYVKRPISMYLTRWLLPMGATANQATAFSALALGASFVGFCAGYGWGFISGGVLLIVFHVADKVDGNLGRFLGGGSPAGEFYDNLAGTASFAVYFFIGLGLWRTPDPWGTRLVSLLSGQPDPAQAGSILFMIGAWTALANCLTRTLRNLFTLNLSRKASPERLEASPGMLSSSRGRHLRKFQVNLVDLQGHDFLPLLAALTGGMSLFLAASAFVQTGNLLAETVYYCRRARRLFPPS
jgi:hypothetical protein